MNASFHAFTIQKQSPLTINRVLVWELHSRASLLASQSDRRWSSMFAKETVGLWRLVRCTLYIWVCWIIFGVVWNRYNYIRTYSAAEVRAVEGRWIPLRTCLSSSICRHYVSTRYQWYHPMLPSFVVICQIWISFQHRLTFLPAEHVSEAHLLADEGCTKKGKCYVCLRDGSVPYPSVGQRGVDNVRIR